MPFFSVDNNSISSDIHLELEGDSSPPPHPDSLSTSLPFISDSELLPLPHDSGLYHPRQALNRAILDWITQVLNVSKILEAVPAVITATHEIECVVPPLPELLTSEAESLLNNLPLKPCCSTPPPTLKIDTTEEDMDTTFSPLLSSELPLNTTDHITDSRLPAESLNNSCVSSDVHGKIVY